ncbi:hypothetical protein [Hydrogenophaga atypica]|uniref:CopG-like ribbon-helix-helix domain-containing protein n=1 Tax=Hydrogenophaga atypica TaxID=249409 RepID=A0ABW2QKH5_9BURK
MSTEKSVGISFRVTPRLKRLLEAAALGERRSLTNMLETLVEEYCTRNRIYDHTEDKQGNRSEKTST